VGVLFV